MVLSRHGGGGDAQRRRLPGRPAPRPLVDAGSAPPISARLVAVAVTRRERSRSGPTTNPPCRGDCPTIAPMAAVLPSTEVRRGRLPLTGSQRLVIFATALGCVAAAIWFGPLHSVVRPNAAISIPWWGELIACCAASLCYVEVRIRGSRTTLSLTEIPVIIGLFAVEPHVLLGCYVTGVLLGHWTRRGIQPVKDYGNLMLDTLYMAVTVLIFTAIGPNPTDPLAAQSILALAVAMTFAGCVIGPLALNTGIYLLQGDLRHKEVLRAFLFQVVATITNTCLGITALVFATNRPWVAFAFIPPILLVLAAQLTASESQRRADRMEFLDRT